MSAVRIALIGSVQSSEVAVRALVRNGVPVVGVLALDPAASAGVSGYVDLAGVAAEFGIPCVHFQRLADEEAAKVAASWSPDVLMVVGLSQLAGRNILDIPRLGCVGFHPTWLPRGRGRAPLAWLTLGAVPAAASFFVMDEGADSGPLLVQEPFSIAPHSYAEDVAASLSAAMDRALDRWLPKLKAGEWNPVPQDAAQATYLGRRTPDDGLIDWSASADEIEALVRAASRPHPGAFTFSQGFRLRVWRAAAEPDPRHKGVEGRILEIDARGRRLVQTGDGLLWLDEIAWDEIDGDIASPPLGFPGVGARLGYKPELEIHRLRRRLDEIEKKLDERSRNR